MRSIEDRLLFLWSLRLKAVQYLLTTFCRETRKATLGAILARSPAARLPSPQRGEGQGGEGDYQAVTALVLPHLVRVFWLAAGIDVACPPPHPQTPLPRWGEGSRNCWTGRPKATHHRTFRVSRQKLITASARYLICKASWSPTSSAKSREGRHEGSTRRQLHVSLPPPVSSYVYNCNYSPSASGRYTDRGQPS